MNNLGLLTLRGFLRVLKLLLKHLGACMSLFFYVIVNGLASLFMYISKCVKYMVNSFPKTTLLIVCIVFALDHVLMMVHYRAKAEKQNIRFDSLAQMKDSIQRISSFDSGYAKGLIDGNQMLLNNGRKQEKSIIHRP